MHRRRVDCAPLEALVQWTWTLSFSGTPTLSYRSPPPPLAISRDQNLPNRRGITTLERKGSTNPRWDYEETGGFFDRNLVAFSFSSSRVLQKEARNLCTREREREREKRETPLFCWRGILYAPGPGAYRS